VAVGDAVLPAVPVSADRPGRHGKTALRYLQAIEHARQAQLLRGHRDEDGWSVTRGAHRDRAWYTAIAEACPGYLGVECPPSSWPTGPRARKGANTLTEVDMTHWPESLRRLANAGDPRLPKIVKAA
jgi:hypothetical protein